MSGTAVDQALEETVSLLEGARDYVLHTESYAAHHFDGQAQRMAAIRESSRLTGLLTAILSWLLWQKAAAAGEISQNELAAKTTELIAEIQAPDQSDEGTALPAQLAELTAQANRLYSRIGGLPGFLG